MDVKIIEKKSHTTKVNECIPSLKQTFLEYTNATDDLIAYICLCWNKHDSETFDENLKKRFTSTHKFANHDINHFNLMLRKVFIHMNTWMIGKNSMRHHYQKEKEFYSRLNMEDITDPDYKQAKRVYKDFNIKNLGDVQSDTLSLADVFNNF